MPSKQKYLILLILALIWGTSFILIKKSVAVFSPYQVGALRVTIAGAILMVYGWPALRRLPKRDILWAAIAGCLGNFIPMYLFPMAEVKVSSSVAGVLNSLVPIFTLILGYLIFHSKSTRIQIMGAVIGFVGAFLLMYFSSTQQGENDLGYAFLIVLATMSYAMSGLVVKEKLNHVKSLDLSGAVFTLWLLPSVLILLISGFFKEFEGTPAQWEGLGYVAILSIVGTAMAMILFYQLILKTTAVFASSVTYLIPIVAVLWGVLTGEVINIWFLIGGVLIIIGVYFIRDQPNLTSKD